MNLNIDAVRGLCHSVDVIDPNPTIDLTAITFIEPFALVYLGVFLRYYKYQGNNFRVKFPLDERVRDYLSRQQFWERFNFSPEGVEAERLRRFETSTSLNDIVDIESRPEIAEDVGDAVKNIIRNSGVSVDASRIGELISEIVDNFYQHSGKILGVFAAQFYAQSNRLVLAVGDCGIGIRESLSRNPTHRHLADGPHKDALVKAFEPLVSRRSEGGTGLTEIREGTIEMGGTLFISTGDAHAQINGALFTSGESIYNFPGVQISLSFPEV